ncbi:MAG: DMT family transporter [Marinosulfonomonas sp.]|nr:DMT family transporter [Marinosulfonomonas sp.]
MGAWFVSIEGTEYGHQVAVALALFAAVLHAFFGVLQKGRHDPWLTRGAVDFSYCAMAAPFALFILPWPEPHMWGIYAIAVVIHIVYKCAQASAYSMGAFTVVYPVVRGTSPLFAALGAYLLFSEVFNFTQWIGVATLVAGIFGLAVYNLRHIQVGRDTLVSAMWMAVFTGAMVAAYTTWDAYGIRATANPFTFLAWFFFLDGPLMAIIAFLRWRAMSDPPKVGPLMARGVLGGVVAYLSFGAILLATRIDNVGQAAVLRETSTVFAALFGWLILKERVGPRRLLLISLIALGAVIVELGA